MQASSSETSRNITQIKQSTDLVVVGGGMAGVCCAITAARAGIRVTIIQDRPVLGGNASSEVRMWIVGATSHMGNNNRWAREGGVIDEILLENAYRNPEGNPLIFDTILLEKVTNEPGIQLLLNTTVRAVEKATHEMISAVTAYCSQNETEYQVSAPYFCDASGDGVVGFLAGAAFRMGAESSAEFGEKLAPSREYGELLGHTIYFYSKDTGRPVKFHPPAFALKDITAIPRWRNFNAAEFGNQLWWIEYGGRLDTIHDSETIKWELWKIVYGVWNHIKNSGQFPEAENLTLEWVGTIPGKRESRRFEGDIMLTQLDVIEQRSHPDDVSVGGWALDLHPADGIYSEKPGCNQWHSKGVYPIPYRCLYSRNIKNLFLAGRIISVSHVAFGSTRVQATLAQTAQAVGMAAAICRRHHLAPADLARQPWIGHLQTALQRTRQFIPGVSMLDEEDLAQMAAVTASSQYLLEELTPDGPWQPLEASWAQLLPLQAGKIPHFSVWVQAEQATQLAVELRTSSRMDNFTPDVTLAARQVSLKPGEQVVTLDFDVKIDQPRYVFLTFLKNARVSICTSQQRVTGLISVTNKTNPAVSNYGKQIPEDDLGVESFEFWIPERRPNGQNLALKISPPLEGFAACNVVNGMDRPSRQVNAWVAKPDDPNPTLRLEWQQPQAIACLDICFDTDFENPLECFLWRQPETAMPFCVQSLVVKNDVGEIVAELKENHHSLRRIEFAQPVLTRSLSVEVKAVNGAAPAAIFAVRCYAALPEKNG